MKEKKLPTTKEVVRWWKIKNSWVSYPKPPCWTIIERNWKHKLKSFEFFFILDLL